MSSYVLMPVAQDDLVGIRDYYLEEAGYRVARQMNGPHPWRRPPAEDLADNRPILFWAMRDYLILYRPGTNPLQILSVTRGSQDAPRIIGRRRL
jgi:plasmid stabilization system protein ParE